MRVEIVTRRGWFKTRWFWRIVAGNGETVAASEVYSSHAKAQQTARKVASLANLPTLEVGG